MELDQARNELVHRQKAVRTTNHTFGLDHLSAIAGTKPRPSHSEAARFVRGNGAFLDECGVKAAFHERG
jgi:hypothetical protein